MVLLVVSIVFALLVSFLCSLLEACLLSLSNAQIAGMEQKIPRTAKVWKKFKHDIQRPIAVILITNTLAHTIGASVAGAQFDRIYGHKWIAVFSIVFSLVMIQFTEILPKTLGVKFNVRIAALAAIPMQVLIRVFYPVLAIIHFVNRPFEGRMKKSPVRAADEIDALAKSAAMARELSREQADLIAGSIRLSGLRAKDIMVPREDMATVDLTMSLGDALIVAHIQRHTRLPLTKDKSIDDIVGYVNFKDIVSALHANPTDPTLRGIRRPILFVSEDMPLNDLVRKLTHGYHHIAVVIDSDGQSVGLVTLEDVVEELVGEIYDEYDRPPDKIVQLGENKYRIGGGVLLSVLRERRIGNFPDEPISMDDWVKAQCGGIASEKAAFEHEGCSVKVRRVTRGMVQDVIVERVVQGGAQSVPPEKAAV